MKPEIRDIEKKFIRLDMPKINIGDTVDVHYRIQEENKTRVQVFSGIVIGEKGGGMKRTFTVRRISYGEGVERIFPVNSPAIEKIVVKKHGKVRRAKLYYLRQKEGKGATKVKEKIVQKKKTKTSE
ncbi:MAG: 50S ribosomal protein L19 [Candidatus Omnitrophica bacterium]|nr:50S ribosomal protein L19 [Candidatus Omnitrophota bacterium]MBU1894982.1 50S ribosomal protein L19 [Candidatus Omnitrophota bacterium]